MEKSKIIKEDKTVIKYTYEQISEMCDYAYNQDKENIDRAIAYLAKR